MLGNQSLINSLGATTYSVFDNSVTNFELTSFAWDIFAGAVENTHIGWNCGGGNGCTNDLGSCNQIGAYENLLTIELEMDRTKIKIPPQSYAKNDFTSQTFPACKINIQSGSATEFTIGQDWLFTVGFIGFDYAKNQIFMALNSNGNAAGISLHQKMSTGAAWAMIAGIVVGVILVVALLYFLSKGGSGGNSSGNSRKSASTRSTNANKNDNEKANNGNNGNNASQDNANANGGMADAKADYD